MECEEGGRNEECRLRDGRSAVEMLLSKEVRLAFAGQGDVVPKLGVRMMPFENLGEKVADRDDGRRGERSE